MSASTLSTSLLKLPPINLCDFGNSSYSLSELFQKIFTLTYLLPFDRDPHLTLKEKEFEVLDASICRVTHGAMHASRVAAYVKVLHVFRCNIFPEDAKIVDPLVSKTSLNTLQLLHLTQIVACLHDAARRAEVADRWDKESSELCLNALQQLFPTLDPSLLACFSKMIEYKDDPKSYLEFLASLQLHQEQIRSWNYLRELIHDADCLDIIRVRKTFDVTFVDLVKQIQHPVQHTSFLELILQIRMLICLQGDQYKDLTILHPFSSDKFSIQPKNFSIATKITYEHAPFVYERNLEDMNLFSWLKTVNADIFITAPTAFISPVVYPKAPLEELFENLTVFKKNQCRIFHGGPVESACGTRWVMPVCFMDEKAKVRSGFELSFINCLPTDASLEEIPIYHVFVSDLDLKTRNTAVEGVRAFMELIHSSAKAIVLRETDLLNICYPMMYNFYLYSDKKTEDLADVLSILKDNYNVTLSPIMIGEQKPCGKYQIPFNGVLACKTVNIPLAGKTFPFFVEHYVSCDDPWGSFYVFRLAISQTSQKPLSITLRFDSGCNTGMIYLDERCCCQQELEEGLLGLVEDSSKDGMLIHFPLHDGRGMGMAPKAEIEIYKRGGVGKIHATKPLEDLEAAKLLFQTEMIDIRTYDAAVNFLVQHGVKEVKLITRSLSKKAAIEKAGINVLVK